MQEHEAHNHMNPLAHPQSLIHLFTIVEGVLVQDSYGFFLYCMAELARLQLRCPSRPADTGERTMSSHVMHGPLL